MRAVSLLMLGVSLFVVCLAGCLSSAVRKEFESRLAVAGDQIKGLKAQKDELDRQLASGGIQRAEYDSRLAGLESELAAARDAKTKIDEEYKSAKAEAVRTGVGTGFGLGDSILTILTPILLTFFPMAAPIIGLVKAAGKGTMNALGGASGTK